MLTIGAGVLVAAWPLPASAAAPSTYGWWSQTSIGGLAGATQPDVPADGMLVQNSPAGAVAISALKFTIAPGDVVDRVTLNISGQAVITQPPIACPVTSPFTAAEGGAWSNRPSYDCAHPLAGSVDSANTTVEFAAAPLVNGPDLALVILAAGPTDRVAFTKPGPEALAVTAGAPTATTEGSRDTTPSNNVLPVAPPVPFQAPAVPAVSVPRSAPAAVAALPPPARSQTVGQDADNTDQAPLIRDGATIFLLPVLLLAILYWTDGFGAFALRRAVSRHRLVRL
jgi:hypothetical protein